MTRLSSLHSVQSLFPPIFCTFIPPSKRHSTKERTTAYEIRMILNLKSTSWSKVVYNSANLAPPHFPFLVLHPSNRLSSISSISSLHITSQHLSTTLVTNISYHINIHTFHSPTHAFTHSFTLTLPSTFDTHTIQQPVQYLDTFDQHLPRNSRPLNPPSRPTSTQVLPVSIQKCDKKMGFANI